MKPSKYVFFGFLICVLDNKIHNNPTPHQKKKVMVCVQKSDDCGCGGTDDDGEPAYTISSPISLKAQTCELKIEASEAQFK